MKTRSLAMLAFGCLMAVTVSAEEIDYTRDRQNPFYLDYESESVKEIYLLLQRAAEAMDAKSWSEASRAFRALNELDPTNPFYVYTLGYIAYQQSEWAEVVRLLEGRTLVDFDEEVALLRGGALINLLRYEEAAVVFQQLLARDGTKANAIRGMATSCLGAGRYQEAVDLFRRLMEVEPDSADAKTGLEAALLAVDMYEKGIPATQLASSHYMMGQRDRAIEILLMQINRRPLSVALQHQVGLYYADMKLLEQSEKHLMDAWLLSPGDPRILNDLGVLAMRKQENDRAFKTFHQAIALNARYATPYRNLARLHRLRGEWTQSVDMAAKALEIEPDSEPARLIAAYGCYRDREFERALEFLSPAMSGKVKLADVWIIAAMCSQMLGRTDQALDYYRKGLALDGEDVLALNNIADIMLSKTNATLAEMREAAEFAQKASMLTSNQNEKVEQTYRDATKRAENMSWKLWVEGEYWKPAR